MAMPAAVMLQRSKSIRASPLLGSFLGRLLPGAAPVGSCQLREISPLPLVYSSIVPSHVRHYVSYKEAYFRFNPSARTNWGIQIVPKNNVFVVERLGKYFKTLNPGIHMLIPVVDRIAYVHSLMEEEIAISNQSFMTKDNINILVDSVIRLKIVDPYLASYGVDNPIFTAASVGRASLQRELGKIALEKAQSEKDTINKKILRVVNEAGTDWGVNCSSFLIRGISLHPRLQEATKTEARAVRKARYRILEAQAATSYEVTTAKVESEALLTMSEAAAERARKLSDVIKNHKNEG